MQTEEWRLIKHAPDYAVSSNGRVRRETAGHLTFPGRIQEPKPNKGCKGGYLRVTLREESGRRFVRPVHRLVCETFHGNPPFTGAQVAHLDGDRRNNSAVNLAWKTAKGNADDRSLHGNTVRGARHHATSFAAQDIQAIRRSPLSCAKAADLYGVSKATISRIRRRVWWRHIEDQPPPTGEN
jgi:hypothetical protein